MSDFKREERYIVVKLKDIDQEETEALREFIQSWQIPTRECVVVEPDWPNYEDTWEAIEQVAKGEYQSPYDLIEQQQAQIAELDATNKALEQNRDQYKREAYALAATVERLRDMLQNYTAEKVCCGQGEIQYSSEGEPIGQECCGKPDVDWPEGVVELLSATPHQNLNAVKREVLNDLLSTMTCSECTCDRHVEQYANQRYPSGKDDE